MFNEEKYYTSLKKLYQCELAKQGVTQFDIDLILGLIKESTLDENQNRMNNDYWKKLQEKGLLDVFEKVSRENNIVWNHFNEEEK